MLSRSEKRSVAIVGGGPAGLRAAEVARQQGAKVVVYDAKASVGRKFLVAGKSGLNLTQACDFESLLGAYAGTDLAEGNWKTILQDFDNEAIRSWAAELDVETFAASSGKVFPITKKAAPLLRRWVLRLRAAGVVFSMNHRLIDFQSSGTGVAVHFSEKDGAVSVSRFDAVVLAFGGASWPQTGSDGEWRSLFEAKQIEVKQLVADNCGWRCAWDPETLDAAEGHPLHNLKVRVGRVELLGELMVTRYGFEGTPVYSLGRHLRRMESPFVEIDFKPTFTVERLVQKMESAKRNFFHEASLRWKLSAAAIAIIRQFYGEFDSAVRLAEIVKNCRIPLIGPRPISEAISTAGGVAWSELNECLMLKRHPGVFCAGEMIDWEAPTGGYLLQGCFATGTRAGRSAGTFRPLANGM